jgi:hypothetical protein
MNRLLLVLFIVGCNVIWPPPDECNPHATIPYGAEEVGEPHCNDKCCEFVVYTAAEACHEMWCYDGKCSWEMTHSFCY